jgi:hypothetical protein
MVSLLEHAELWTNISLIIFIDVVEEEEDVNLYESPIYDDQWD